MQLDTLFLDRDGVINEKLNGRYVKDFSEFKFINKIPIAMNILAGIFSKIIVVTNQQGIGKGVMSEKELLDLHKEMTSHITIHGGKISKIYYCPHLASDYCLCRKPRIGMFKQALEDFPEIKIESSYLVGDSNSDIQAGNSIGLRTVKVDNQYTLYSWSKELIKVLKL